MSGKLPKSDRSEGAVTGTAEERAAEVKRRILAEVEAGRFRLGEGYCRKIGDKPCRGCALGALAFALSVYFPDGAPASEVIAAARARTAAAAALSLDEIEDLELGYEEVTSASGYEGRTVPQRLPNTKSPFYRVGAELRELAR